MEIFNIGLGEMFFIFIIALIVFGPDRLPELARKAGLIIRELRRMSAEVTEQVQRELDLVEEPVREVREIAAAAATQARGDLMRLEEPVREVQETLSAVKVIASGAPVRPSAPPPNSQPDPDATGTPDLTEPDRSIEQIPAPPSGETDGSSPENPY